MGDVGSRRATRVPDCTGTVRRDRILRLLQRFRTPCVFIWAPAAYGKSVLAAQMALEWGESHAVWVTLPDDCATDAQVAEATLRRLCPDRDTALDRFIGVVPSRELADMQEMVFEALRAASAEPVCLVLDNVQSAVADTLHWLLQLPLRMNSPVGCLIVTTRHAPDAGTLMPDTWSIGPTELLLDDPEAESLVSAALGGPDSAACAALTEASGRQAGLLSVLSRWAAAQPGGYRDLPSTHPQVLVILEGLAHSQLAPSQLAALQYMALLGEGSLAEVRLIEPQVARGDLEACALALPLVSLGPAREGSAFRVHDLARQAFGSPSSLWAAEKVTFMRVMEILAQRGDYALSLHLVLEAADDAQVQSWVRRVGRGLLCGGSREVMRSAFARVPAIEMVGDPEILILKAVACLEDGEADEARRCAQVAREVAEHEGSLSLVLDALVTLAQVEAGQGDFVLSRTYSDRAVRLCDESSDPRLLPHLHGRRMLMSALLGDYPQFSEARAEAVALHDRMIPGDPSAAQLRFFTATSGVALEGNWAEAMPVFESGSRVVGLGHNARVSMFFNHCGALLELGRVDRAEEVLQELQTLVADGPEAAACVCGFLVGGLRATRGDAEGLASQTAECSQAAWVRAERLAAITGSTSGSLALLGNRRMGEALAAAERASGCAHELGALALEWPAQLECAAALLAADDVGQATRIATAVHQAVSSSGSTGVHLKADVVLALVDDANGRRSEAVSRLAEHLDYVLTESANWQLAMYTRAFPRLLGLLTSALGAASLPAHMLRLILPEYAEDAVAAAKDVLPPEEFDILSQRVLGRRAAGRRSSDRGAGEQTCIVRFFGGLHVEADGRVVQDKQWRKRKARLLFAMLATRCGKDIPREQLIEYLWPEMDADQALNNLYVVWSSMKGALSPSLGRGADCPYVEHRRGVCRAVGGRVLTDLDEFEGQLLIATKARADADETAELTALQKVAEVYRGELLPGEIYDDWFATQRERCRHDFEDAMMRAAALLEARGDAQGGVSLLRRALQHDPWREDLYQAALRLQMVAGQRSAAIETYMTCRSRLVEDLGIDPSSETKRLYEQVLGMEEGPAEYPR
jgi:DNA-binding SARP family transcriptional activator